MGVLDLQVRKRQRKQETVIPAEWLELEEKNQALEEDDKLNLDMLSVSSL